MRLCVYTEPEFGQSLWHAAALRGIGEEARRKRYELTLVGANELGLSDDGAESSDCDRRLESAILGDDSSVELIPPLIVLASSPTRLARLTEKLKVRELGALLVNIVPENTEFSTISMDYENATRLALRHMRDCGCSRVALFGINHDSGSDRAKLAAFGECDGRVFYNQSGLDRCVCEFIDRVGEFDGVICANDIAGIALLTRLKAVGVDVPRELALMSFGDSASAGSLCTSLGVTLITVDHAKLGRQAVTLAAYLARAESSLTATVKLASELVPGCTAVPCEPVGDCETRVERIRRGRGGRSQSCESEREHKARDFYDDPLVREVMLIEALAESIDETDRALILLLGSGETVQSAAERLYLSPGAASYRLRRLVSRLGLSSRGEMLELIGRYFGDL